jgi:hypothetical protein
LITKTNFYIQVTFVCFCGFAALLQCSQKPDLYVRDQLDTILKKENVSADEIINHLETNFELKSFFDGSNGVLCANTIRTHVQKSFKTLEDQYKFFDIDHIDVGGISAKEFMRLFIILHDIGKPFALALGDRNLQHEYSAKIIKSVMKRLGFNNQTITLAITFVENDIMGDIRQEKISAQKGLEKLAEQAGKTVLSIKDFFTLILLFFIADAGSYQSVRNLDAFDYVDGQLIIKSETYKQIKEAIFSSM